VCVCVCVCGEADNLTRDLEKFVESMIGIQQSMCVALLHRDETYTLSPVQLRVRSAETIIHRCYIVQFPVTALAIKKKIDFTCQVTLQELNRGVYTD
jgi:hypothetical protein